MPLTAPAVTKRIGSYLADIAKTGTPAHKAFMGPIAKRLRGEARQMYRFGLDPFGVAWKLTKDGRQPYRSNKMGNALRVEFDQGSPGCLQVFYVVSWIKAADEGHTFPARQVEANKNYLTFRNGRLVSERSIFFRKGKKAGQLRSGVQQVYARAHTVGSRVLPARRQEPHGVMPPAWGVAINEGVEQAIEDLGRRLTR